MVMMIMLMLMFDVDVHDECAKMEKHKLANTETIHERPKPSDRRGAVIIGRLDRHPDLTRPRTVRDAPATFESSNP